MKQVDVKDVLIKKNNLILAFADEEYRPRINNNKIDAVKNFSSWIDKIPEEKLFELDEEITDLVNSYDFKFGNSELEYTIPYPKDPWFDPEDDNAPPFEEGKKWRELRRNKYRWLVLEMYKILSSTKFFYEYTRTDLINLTEDYRKYKEQEYKTYSTPGSGKPMKKVSNRLTSFLDNDVEEVYGNDCSFYYVNIWRCSKGESFQNDYPHIANMFVSYQLPTEGNPVNPYNFHEDYRVEEDWIDNFIKKQEEKFARIERAEKATANKQPVATTPVQTIADVVKANTGRE